MFDIKKAAYEMLEGCIIRSQSGVDMYTPDGQGNYPALWTRDFAYMLSSAQELMDPARCKACLEYLMDNADTNGWIPDRVDAQGVAEYTAGNHDIPASPNLDNGPFLILAADAYLRTLPATEAKALFAKWENTLCAGIDCLPKNEDGMIYNMAMPPHSPYGFTDNICKTGALAMETLLLWQSVRALLYWQVTDAERYTALQASIENAFCRIFLSDTGMLLAATGHCRQIDVWASCYMLAIEFPMTKEQKDRMTQWLNDNYNSIVYAGQIRHLPAGKFWEKTLIPVPENTYQNGAYWATPTVWLVQALLPYDADLAKKTVLDVCNYFGEKGIFECIYPDDDYYKLDTYVVSATNVYAAAKLVNLI